jgi:hypothetical protein
MQAALHAQVALLLAYQCWHVHCSSDCCLAKVRAAMASDRQGCTPYFCVCLACVVACGACMMGAL